MPSRRFGLDPYAISGHPLCSLLFVRPRPCTIVKTRSPAKRIKSMETHGNDGVANDIPPPAKQRQHPQGEPLNLDVLSLVRAFPFIFCGRSLIGTMLIDCCIRPPSRPLEPCMHLQIFPGAPDAQLLGARVEDRSPQNQGPALLPGRLDRTGIRPSRILCSLPRTYGLLSRFEIS